MFGVTLVFLGCFGIGMTVAARWLPDLAPGRVGGLAFTTVCILLGAALGMAGLHIYSLVSDLHHLPSGASQTEILAGILRNILLDTGTLIGFAGAIYLLAPPADEQPAAAELAEDAA